MKKIAILTQPLKTNYGGILQNYALQTVVKELGYNPVTIDIHYKEYSKIRIFLSLFKNRILNKIKGKKIKYFSVSDKKRIARNSTFFIDNHIKRSKKIMDDELLKKHFSESNYHTIIVGSDQTWRPKYSPNIYNYFLSFLENNATIKKIAYASSFGTSEWEFNDTETKICKKLAQKFNTVSVREDSGVDLCKKHLEVKAELVLDPTLLLEPYQYIELFNSLKLPDGEGGLYTYVLDRNENKKQVIQKVSSYLDLKEYRNQPKESVLHPKSNNINDYVYPSVETWIKGFYDADFIVTDSFHGTVFSILFNKPFIAITNQDRGVSRFNSLLKQFGLEDRLISNFSELDVELLAQKIDYNLVNQKLLDLKIKSLEFLKNNI